MPEIESEEAYQAIRSRYIIQGVYRGDDTLPLETKDVLLRQAIGNPQINFHSTTVKENGETRENHVDFATRVNLLEMEVLGSKGFICGKLC